LIHHLIPAALYVAASVKLVESILHPNSRSKVGFWRLRLASGLMPSNDPLSVPALVAPITASCIRPQATVKSRGEGPIQRSVRNANQAA